MKIPLSWLKKYVDLPFSNEKIAETLTLAGLEVDDMQSIGNSFTGVVVGKVLETAKHPNADKLQIAQVSDGTEIFQVVCGASNCRKGLTTAFAKIGATLPDETGSPWKIKKSKIRDVESFGMLCASDELGLENAKAEGILELSDDLIPGTDLSSFYADTIFDISLTPNLGHCMSVYGIARELSAFFQLPLKPLEAPKEEPSSLSSFIHVSIEDKNLCPRYSCKLLRSVTVGPSPSWLVKDLELVGLRSVNNVVDISNYVMLLTGHPLHFFDYDLLEDKTLYISSLEKNQEVTTLDNIKRLVPQGAAVIRDTKKIVAIGGVIGTNTATVTSETKNILMEAAVFNPVSIRKTSKALSLKTDASNRFEKGIDQNMPVTALFLAETLLKEVAGGEPSSLIDLYPNPPPLKTILCRESKVNSLLGTSLSLREIKELLTRLQLRTLEEHSHSLTVEIPSYRNDISREVDLIEEVARIYGYNHLPKSFAAHISSSLIDSPIFSMENKTRALLQGEGLQEFLTCDLISPTVANLTKETNDKITDLITVLQSKSADYSVLRASLLPGLLQLTKHNLDHQNQNISGFEIGRVHFKQKEQFQEQVSIGIVLSGLKAPHYHDPKPKEVDFFDLKGIVENFLDAYKIPNATYEISHLHNFQPGKQARIKIGDISLGVLGEVHPNTLKTLDIPQRVFFAELDLEELYRLEPKKIEVKPLAIMPASERDWTVTLRKAMPVEEFLACIKESAPPLLEKAFLLDLFESDKIGQDRKNATWRFIYRDNIKTVDFETVEKEHGKLIQKVAEKLGNCIL